MLGEGFLIISKYIQQMQIMAIVLGLVEFGIHENIEAFPVDTHPLVPIK